MCRANMGFDMSDKEYVIVREFQRMAPEEMYKRNIDKISVSAYVDMYVSDLNRGEAVYFSSKLVNTPAIRVAIAATNNAFKQIYKNEGFSDKIRKYAVHKDGEGAVVVRVL